MRRPLIVIICIPAALSCIMSSCCSQKSPQVDAVSGATSKYIHGQVVLPPPADSYEVVGVVDGLKNYVIKYDDTLYRGGEPFAESALQSLEKLGVRTVVSITPTEHERKLCRENNLALVEIPFEKTKGLSRADLELYLNTIRAGSGPFYVHCHGGTHRGGVLGFAYRVHIQGWDYNKALVEFGRLGGDLLSDHIMLESAGTARQ